MAKRKKHCVRFKRTSSGRRCAKFSGGKAKTRGKAKKRHCTSFAYVAGERRCRSYSKGGRKRGQSLPMGPWPAAFGPGY